MSERHMVKTSLSPIAHIESHQYIPKITAVNDTWLQHICIQDLILTAPSFMQKENDFFEIKPFLFRLPLKYTHLGYECFVSVIFSDNPS